MKWVEERPVRGLYGNDKLTWRRVKRKVQYSSTETLHRPDPDALIWQPKQHPPAPTEDPWLDELPDEGRW